MTGSRRLLWRYGLLALAGAAAGIVLGFTDLATRLDNDIYDVLFRRRPVPERKTLSAILAIDEDSLQWMGGLQNVRRALAENLPAVAEHRPLAVAIDLTLTDAGDLVQSQALAGALRALPGLVLGSEMMPDGSRWQDPLPLFQVSGAALGHVNALPDEFDSIVRAIPLERVAGRQRRWALAFETWRVARRAGPPESSPTDVKVGDLVIHSRWDQGRPMRVRFGDLSRVPRVSLRDLARDASRGEQFRGRAVFVGVTAQSASRDRVMTPVSNQFPYSGVEVHAQAFETIDHHDFLDDTPAWWPIGLALLSSAVVALIFTFWQGWRAVGAATLVLAAVHAIPWWLFGAGLVLPAFAPITAAWIATLLCAGWQYFFVRRQLARSEADRHRYQQAIRFVTHEMRTPLTAIQGSSELITRYSLSEEKRKQLGSMINSESKRLAQMITTFLNVEKLGAGQLELKRTDFPLADLVTTCLDRARPLADRKQIQLMAAEMGCQNLSGDRELMEYAVYNLITNAIKYSPEKTNVQVEARRDNGQLELSVRDQGMGMTETEVKNLFRKFYRTESAERSGETGTGLGLSIVEQIVAQHGGRVAVASAPGKGSCFTIVLPAPRG